jgi:2-keto-4-pentenoate hydratase
MSENHSEWAQNAASARAKVTAFELPEVDTVAAGYELQDAYVGAVERTRGGVGGFKLAVNGKPQMAYFDVSEPASARIFADEIHHSGVALPRAGFLDVSIEPELAAVLGPNVASLSGPVDRAGALAVIDRFHGAIELIDQRGIPMPQVKLPQAVALNVMNAGIVLGAGRIAPAALDLATLDVTLHLDGEVAAQVSAAAPQDPVEAVMWLLNHLLARGVNVAPGMVVMCGTHMPLRTLDRATTEVSVAMSGLGSVSFSLVD